MIHYTPMFQVSGVKNFLEANKVYLDWISGIFTSLGAILVGILALRFSGHANRLIENQNEILKHQSHLMETPLKPLLRFVRDTVTDPQGLPVERLQIFNDGAPIISPYVFKRDFIIISYEAAGDAEQKANLLVPCYYYGLHEFSHGTSGLIVTLEAYSGVTSDVGRQSKFNHTVIIKQLKEQIITELEAQGIAHQEVRLRKILNFGYTDQAGQTHDEYFEIADRGYNMLSSAWRVPREHIGRLYEGLWRRNIADLRVKEIFQHIQMYETEYVERNIPG